jgi:hypothetical protein
MKFLFHDRIHDGDFSGRILFGACICAANSNESAYAARFRCTLKLGVSAFLMKRSGFEVGSAKRNRHVRDSY